MIADQLTGEDRLFIKCEASVADILFETLGGSADEALHTAHRMLTNQHDGVAGPEGEKVVAVFLEQHRVEQDMWRVRMVIYNSTATKHAVLSRSFGVTPEEAPTKACMVTEHSNVWLLFPKQPKCSAHKDKCPTCTELMANGTLFRDDMPPTDLDVMALVLHAYVNELKDGAVKN